MIRVTQKRGTSTHRNNVPKLNATVVANALESAKTGQRMTTKRETKLMMSIGLNMSVQSGVTRKNTKPNRGRKNALGLPAAHAQNALMVMLKHNAKALVTLPRESSILRSNAAKKNARVAVNVQVSVSHRNRRQTRNVMTRVIQKRGTSTHLSNAPKTNVTVVVNALAPVKIGILWMTMRRGTKSMMSICLNMNVRNGVTRKNTKRNRGRENATGLLAAHVLSVMWKKKNVLARATQQKVSSVLRSSAAKTNAQDAANAQVSVLRRNRQKN